MIPADYWLDNGDGTAWIVFAEGSVFDQHFTGIRGDDRPCDTCDGGGYPNHELPICPDCDGTGRHTFTVEVACPCTLGRSGSMPDCGGTGIRTHRVSVVPDMVEEQEDGTWRVQLNIHE